MSLEVRLARESDAHRLWEWRNDPAVRAVSFDSASIAWDLHVAWFAGRLSDADCRWWIAEEREQPVGQIRYDRRGRDAIVSLSIDPASRGRGLGTAMLTMTMAEALAALGSVHVVGLVRSENIASRRTFERAGFERVAATVDRLTYRWPAAPAPPPPPPPPPPETSGVQ